MIEVARAGHADIVAVGNEVLLREDMAEDELLACIQRVKQALPGVPVGYVDAYYLFEKHPRITAACDVVMTNCYPFWEGCPREQALAYMQTMVRAHARRGAGQARADQRDRLARPGQRLPRLGAFARRGDAATSSTPAAGPSDDGIELFYFAAFDEAWKVGAEGDVGAYWGLWDKDGEPKFA